MKKTLLCLLISCLLLLSGCKSIDPAKKAEIDKNIAMLAGENDPAVQELLPEEDMPDLDQTQEAVLSMKTPTKAQLLSRYCDAVVMGDSVIQAGLGYGYLDNSKIIAKIGASVLSCKEMQQSARRARPDTLFLCFGLNDVEIYEENAGRFIKDYEKLIADLQEQLPATRIRVLAISPVNDEALKRKPVYQYIDGYNEALEEMCERLDLRYIDASFLLRERPEYYDVDGVHPKGNYYPLWLYYVAEMGGLPDA